MNKRPLAVIAVFFIIGIVLARFLPDSVKFPHIFIVTLVFIIVSFIFSRIDSRFRGNDKEIGNDNGCCQKIANIFLLLSITSFAALLYLNSNIWPDNHISHFLGEEKLKTGIVGIIKSPALTRKPYYGKINSTYIFELEAIKGHNGKTEENEWLGVKGLTQIRIQTEEDYGYGDRLFVRGTIRRPAGIDSRLPSGKAAGFRGNDKNRGNDKLRGDSNNRFDYRAYLERQNIFALINTKEHNVTVLSHNYKSNPILKYIYSIRERLKDQILEYMPLDSGAFLRAILLGDRSELPKHIQTSFKNSGTMHILAISGLHIAIIVLVILYLFRIIGVKREVSYCFTIIFLIFFALFTLSRPSVVRASIMACAFLMGMLLGRKVDVYNSLGFAALFILIKNPKDLFNVGFQLSFLAVVSILFFVPRLMKLVQDYKNYYVKRFLYIPLAVSVSAWIGTFPLILYYFKIITPVAIIANLFIIPMLSAMLIASMAFLALGWLPVLGPFLGQANHLIAQVIFSLADFFASLKFGHTTYVGLWPP